MMSRIGLGQRPAKLHWLFAGLRRKRLRGDRDSLAERVRFELASDFQNRP
jgi:hypothetical protein